MKTSIKFMAIMLASSCFALIGCNNADENRSVAIDATPQTVEQVAELAPLPTDPIGLQIAMIEAFSKGDIDTFESAKNAYVNDITDRRQQRDFVNEIWTGSDNYEKNRELAFPIAKALSDAYDISAPTYLTGFAYWMGEGVEKDLGKTLEYWAKPSVDDNATVHYRRASIYLDDSLPYFDAAKGREIMVMAADKGNEDAAKWLAEN